MQIKIFARILIHKGVLLAHGCFLKSFLLLKKGLKGAPLPRNNTCGTLIVVDVINQM